MATNDPNSVEVTLAADLPVGPRGGVVKADEQVRLPYADAALLVYEGKARYGKTSAPVGPIDGDATTAAGTGAGTPVEGGSK